MLLFCMRDQSSLTKAAGYLVPADQSTIFWRQANFQLRHMTTSYHCRDVPSVQTTALGSSLDWEIEDQYLDLEAVVLSEDFAVVDCWYLNCIDPISPRRYLLDDYHL